MGGTVKSLTPRQRRERLPQKGFSQLLQGQRLAVARAVELDMHAKHAFEVCRAIRNKTAGEALDHLEAVQKLEAPVAYRRGAGGGKGGRKGRRGGGRGAGHRKGHFGPGRYPSKVSHHVSRLIRSAMDNATQQHEDIDAESMVITHVAAHRGNVHRGWRPRARGRATPNNHHQVNLEIFLEDFTGGEDDDLF